MPLASPLALSLFYSTFFSVLGVYLPYFNLYLHALGFTGTQIGVVSAVLPLCTAVIPAASGILSDRLGRRRVLVALSTFLALVAAALLPWARRFGTLTATVAAYAALRAPALPLVEATAMEVSESGGPHYGRMRLWGSIAFILVALGLGPLVAARGVATVVPVMIALLALNALAALLLPPDATAPGRPAPGAAVARAAGWPAILLFLGAALLMQASHGPYYVFYSIHLEKAGYGAPAIGALWALAVACEIVAMLRMPALLARHGPLPVMAGAFLLASVRWWICSASVAPLAMMAAQSLHAASFGAFHVAAVTHAHRLFGEGRRASGQALYGAATYGAGNVLGMLVSGSLYDRAGMPELFLWAARVALFGGFLVLLAARRGGRAAA